MLTKENLYSILLLVRAIRKLRQVHARVAQLVEHDLAKVGVAGSSPVSRSNEHKKDIRMDILFCVTRAPRLTKKAEVLISKGTFEGTLDIQRQLLNDYREEVRKYAEGVDQTRIIGHSDNIYTFPYFCAFLLKDYLKEVGVNV